MCGKGKSTETEGRWVVARGWGREEWGVSAGWVGIFWGDGNVLELGMGGCTTLGNVPNAAELCTLKWFILCFMTLISINQKQ